MIARFLLLVGIAVSVSLAGMAQDESKAAARAELDSGVQAYKQANYQDAIDHFNRAVNLDPEFMVARQYLANSYAAQFTPGLDTPENVVWATNALGQYSEILRRNPSDIHSIKGVAFLQVQLKDFEQAKESYKKAATLDPSDPESFYSIGVIDWSMVSRDIKAEKAKVGAESEDTLFMSPACTDARAATLANIDDGIGMLTKAVTLRKDYDDAMAYINFLYRLRAEVECGSQQEHDADVTKANGWVEEALVVRKKKIDAAAKGSQNEMSDKPRP
ncbi:MAG: repeat protein [Candidatus Angelobacter sp.]|nr:repeat protein [Candidatus Angelobacter sp.]